ncbi:MAG: murein L,D-transpeptidase catalytic domain family protein [Porticoccaceae bacterium]|jgi:hypothetical protein
MPSLRCLLAVAVLAATPLLAAAAGVIPGKAEARAPSSLLEALAGKAPALSKTVLSRAIGAMDCAIGEGIPAARRLAVIDFSLPSSKPRMWIFDLARKTLLLEELVAHGKNSGDDLATIFSNREGSHQSSIGLFLAAESYVGRHGYSLRMDGLEPGINDKARDRAIVIHGADYVDSGWIERHGRIGRSQGCPAVRPEVADQVVDSLKDGQFVFSYYPDEEWLASSPYLNCRPEQVAGTTAPLPDSDS